MHTLTHTAAHKREQTFTTRQMLSEGIRCFAATPGHSHSMCANFVCACTRPLSTVKKTYFNMNVCIPENVFCERAYFLFVVTLGACRAHDHICFCGVSVRVGPGSENPFTQNTRNLNKTLDSTPCTAVRLHSCECRRVVMCARRPEQLIAQTY